MKNLIFTFRDNYRHLIGASLLIIIGYILMSVGNSTQGNHFEPSIFSHLRISVAPLVCIAGYTWMIIGIMRTPKKEG